MSRFWSMLKVVRFHLFLVSLLLVCQDLDGQDFNAGFTTLVLKDTTRVYKPNTVVTDSLHFRPVELDIWYPSQNSSSESLIFKDLFQLFEQRAVQYDDQEDYTGLVKELAQFYVAELGVGTDADKLLSIPTSSYKDLPPVQSPRPLIIYMAGFNGMGFENYKVLENLARNGFVVVSIWSVGRYPGNMTNQKEDMLEQVYDAEFAIEYLRNENLFNVDLNNIGVLGCSWGGMSAAVLTTKRPEIRSMVSLDGTETHYFGEVDTNAYFGGADGDDNDEYIRQIQNDGLLKPEEKNISYLYYESGDKLSEFKPSGEYNYYRKLNSEKYYLRFKNSTHADFTCIPSILKASQNSIETYKVLDAATVAFFKSSLLGEGNFSEIWNATRSLEGITEHPFDLAKIEDRVLTSLTGTVLDAKTNAPLQYVNVGILNKGVGTVTRKDGHFQMEVPKELLQDTLKISMLGYKPYEIVVDDIEDSKKPMIVTLEEQASELEEVVLTAKAFKKKTLGNTTESKFLGTGFGYDQLGAEMGVKINIKRPTYVDTFNFNISHNRLSAQAVFRLNMYKVIKGKPGENIMREQILVSIDPKETGLMRVDLRPYKIVLVEDVIVTLEWVDNLGENLKGEAIFFSLGMFNNGTLYKHSSQARFKKHSSFGVGFNLDVRI